MKHFRHYLTREHGTLSLETVIVFPLLLWAFGATFLFWDAFHAQTIAERSAYTIADVLSRETNVVDDNYLDGMQKLESYLLQGKMATQMRVTTIDWNATNSAYEVIWSRSPDPNWAGMTDAELNAQAARVPAMATGDVAIIVETHTRYIPFLNFIGLKPMTIENFVVTRPRNGPQLVWQNADGTTIGYTGS